MQSVEEVLPNLADRELVFWKTSNRAFRSGMVDTTLEAPVLSLPDFEQEKI